MWQIENNKLVKKFEFKNFIEAFQFLTKVASIAENLKHHPEIYNCYNKVTLELTTHDMNNSITEKDYELANAIDGI